MYYLMIPNGNQNSYGLIASLKYKDDAETLMRTYSTAYITYEGEIIAHVGDIPELAK